MYMAHIVSDVSERVSVIVSAGRAIKEWARLLFVLWKKCVLFYFPYVFCYERGMETLQSLVVYTTSSSLFLTPISNIRRNIVYGCCSGGVREESSRGKR